MLEEALTETDARVVHYQLACVEALDGNTERALDELDDRGRAADRLRAHAAKDEDFASIRDDPRFPELTVARQPEPAARSRSAGTGSPSGRATSSTAP